MKLQPIIYTTDMARTVDWYGKVLDADPDHGSDMWTAFTVDGAALGIHHAEAPKTGSNVELSLIATEPLEEIVAKLAAAGISVERGIEDETFGRSVLLRDPDGSPLQINEHTHQ